VATKKYVIAKYNVLSAFVLFLFPKKTVLQLPKLRLSPRRFFQNIPGKFLLNLLRLFLGFQSNVWSLLVAFKSVDWDTDLWVTPVLV
jgi:hypothetical protein